MDIPQKYKNLVGTKVKVTGCLFSYTKEFKTPTEFNVLNIKESTAIIVDTETLEELHPTYKLLLKREGMKKAQWSKPFAIPEIKLKDHVDN